MVYQIPETGVPEIDAQHRELLACLNRFEFWDNKGQGTAAQFDALLTLRHYVTMHFRDEEKLMERYQFPDLQNHIREHVRICNALDMVESHMTEGLDVGSELHDMLRNWIIEHIGSEDMSYVRHINHTAKPD